jgi:hypothetical protein
MTFRFLRTPSNLLLDAGDDLARRVEGQMRHFVEDRAVALMSDAGEDRQLRVANEACQRVVIEPREIVDRAAAADDDDGVGKGGAARRPFVQRRSQRRHDLGRGAVALEAAECVDEMADAELLESHCFLPEVAEPGAFRWSDHEHRREVPWRGQ